MKISASLSSESFPSYTKLYPSSLAYTNVFLDSFEFLSLLFHFNLWNQIKDRSSKTKVYSVLLLLFFFFIKLETSFNVAKQIAHKVFILFKTICFPT